MRMRSYFLIPLALIALSLGWLCAIIHSPAKLNDSLGNEKVLQGRIIDLEYTDFSMRLIVELLNDNLPPSRVLVTTRGCDYTMQAGDVIAWPAALKEIKGMGNPYDMDYARYLLDNKGIIYEQHLRANQIVKLGHTPTLFTRMAVTRRTIQLRVFNSRLSPPAQHFVVALLLGNSDFIDKATREEFSAAGVAHVLALSGLHVGLIALIIWWILFPLDYLRMRKPRLVITIAAIFLFAIFTGLSPSVVRATLMTGFVFTSLLFYRRSVSLNALMMSALIILVFSPSSLYSVGFQLSFITVGAILLFARVPDAIKSRHQWINRLTSTVITSLVAALATVALSAHYFHTISFMTVLANLLILPILPFFMVLGALFLLVLAAGMNWTILERAIDSLSSYIHWSAIMVNSLPLSHIKGVYVSTLGVIIYFIILTCAALWIYRHGYRYLLAAGSALLALLIHSLWLDCTTPSQGIIIFNSFSSTPVLCYNHGKGYVWVPDDEETDSSTFARYYAGFLARHRIDELRFIGNQDSLVTATAMIKPPHAYLMGHRIVAVGRGKWKNAISNQPLSLDEVIVTKRYHGTAAKLQELFHFKRLVLSGAYYQPQALIDECDSLHIQLHNVASEGALQIH